MSRVGAVRAVKAVKASPLDGPSREDLEAGPLTQVSNVHDLRYAPPLCLSSLGALLQRWTCTKCKPIELRELQVCMEYQPTPFSSSAGTPRPNIMAQVYLPQKVELLDAIANVRRIQIRDEPSYIHPKTQNHLLAPTRSNSHIPSGPFPHPLSTSKMSISKTPHFASTVGVR